MSATTPIPPADGNVGFRIPPELTDDAREAVLGEIDRAAEEVHVDVRNPDQSAAVREQLERIDACRRVLEDHLGWPDRVAEDPEREVCERVEAEPWLAAYLLESVAYGIAEDITPNGSLPPADVLESAGRRIAAVREAQGAIGAAA